MVTRKEAIEQGLKTYLSNKICKHCNGNERYVSTYSCKSCAIEKGLQKLNNSILMEKYRTPEKNKNKLRKWRKENPDKVKIQRKRTKDQRLEFYKNNKNTFRERQLIKNYGMTIEQYDAMLLAQDNKCAICRCEECPTGKLFAVDHCHETGSIRGILCFLCNSALGQLKNETNLINALNYLRKV